jgi:predicted Zn-dependent protease
MLRFEQSLVALVCLLAITQPVLKVSAVTQQPVVTGSALTKKGFDYLLNLQSDQAILALTPVLIAKARNITNGDDKKAVALLFGLIGRGFQIDENDLAGEQCLYFACLLDPGNKVYQAIRADILARCGRVDESDQLLKNLHPQAGDKLILTSVIATKLNREMNSGPAVKMLTDAIATTRDTDNLTGGYLALARALARVGFTSQSHKYFKLASEKSNSPYLSKIYLGLAAQSLFDAREAKKDFEEAGKILPDDPTWLNCLSGNPILNEDEKLRIKKQASNCRRFSTDALVGYSRRLSTRNRTHEALACADQIQHMRPYAFDSHYLRAKILQSNSHTAPTAEGEYQAASKALPDAANLYCEFAQFYVETKKLDQAEQTYLAGTKRCPEAESIWSGLAILSVKQARWDNARKSAEHALTLLPAKVDQLNIVQQNEFARMHAVLGVYDYNADKIDQAFEQAKIFNQFKLLPKLPPILKVMEVRPDRLKFDPGPNQQAVRHVALADMLYEMRQLKGAVKEYRLALKEDPDSVDTHTYLLNALWEDNQWVEAAQEDWSLSNKLVLQLPARAEEVKKLFEQKPDEKQKYAP